MNLYEIDARIQKILDTAINLETGEVDETLWAELEELEVKKVDKIEAVLLYRRGVEADIESIGKEISRLQGIKEGLSNKSERLKKYAQDSLQGKKLKTTKISVWYKTNESVEFTGNIENLPECCVRRKEPEVNKAELKKLLDSGKKIDGARLAESVSMVIR